LAGFIFPLEKVLRFRENVEKKYLKIFSLKKAGLLEVESRIQEESKKLRDFTKRINFSRGVFSPDEIISVHNYIFRVEKKIEELEKEREIKRIDLNRALEKLNEARKERLVIEKLRERQYRRYIEELTRAEEKEIDDINQKIGFTKEKLTIEDLPLEDT